MPNRIFKDLRIYESDQANIAGNSLPQEFGSLFQPTIQLSFILQRIARKLNELQFSLGDIDHLYLNFSTFVTTGTWQVAKRVVDPSILYVDIGLEPTTFNQLDSKEKETLITHKAFEILQELSPKTQLPLLKQTAQLLQEQGSELMIHYKTKQTNHYTVHLAYQIRPQGNQSRVWLTYEDHKLGTSAQTSFPLLHYRDLYALVGSISKKGQQIVLKPKSSFGAALHTNDYQVPYIIELKDLEPI